MSFLYKQYESLHKLRLPTVTVVQNTQMWNPRPLSFFLLGLYPTPRPQNHSSKGEQPSQVAQQWVKNLPAMQETRRHGFDPWVGKSLRKRKWQPTPVFLHGKFYGQRSLVSYSPRGHKESDTHTKENGPPPTYLVFISALFPHLPPIGFKMALGNEADPSPKEKSSNFVRARVINPHFFPQRNWRFVSVIVDFLQTLGFQSCLRGMWGEEHLVH